ncbi:CoA transferase [Sporosarcina sp. 179-K 3D1 HS]|uniref:CoA transferase n=1 Tax=Sporosarcina sp. 179-K 3D1 HS TaxID=3232169 RepID=UPI0039A2F8EC
MERGRDTILLEGLRILDLTYGPSGGYAGRLFAESGAHVTKVVTGDQEISTFKDSRKRMIRTTDNQLPETIAEQLAVGHWDIVLWDSHMALHLESQLASLLEKISGSCLSVRIHFPSTVDVKEEHALQEWGGWTSLTGDPHRSPLYIGGFPATSLVGAHTAAATMFAWLEQKKGFVQVDALTVVVSALEGVYTNYLETGEVRERVGNRHHTLTPMSIFPCQNGFSFIGAPVDEQWELLERWMGRAPNPNWASVDERQQSYPALEHCIADWTQGMEREELFHTGQAFRLPFGDVQTLEDVKRCPHLNMRHFWKGQHPSDGIQLPWIIYRHSSCKLENRSHSLKRLRILDLTSMWSGPYCTRLFADHGAEVIKVEAPHRPDGIRGNSGESPAPFFNELNRNKCGITLDLRQEEERAKFLKLVATSDILIDNFSPRVMENFGLTREVLWAQQPGLIIMSLSAFGQTGPYRDYVGYGPTLESMSGLASLTGYRDGIPWLPGFSISDIGAGIHGTFALLAALYFQRRFGNGLAVDLSQYEAAIQLIGDYIIEETFSPTPLQPVGCTSIAELAIQDQRPLEVKTSDGKRSISTPWIIDNPENQTYEPAPTLGQHNPLLEDYMAKREWHHQL